MRTIMGISLGPRLAAAALALLCLESGGTSLRVAQAAGAQRPREYVRMEPDTDRPGRDYRNFEMIRDARPEACQAECVNDAKCRALTYVKPGIQGRYARCWLKEEVPKPVADRCCISGIKTLVR
jgi:PAN domain